MSKLAILGGSAEVTSTPDIYKAIGRKERQYVEQVLDSGCLSSYVGAWGEFFEGGIAVQKFERAWQEAFLVKHAVSVNSATSGLFAAIGAIGVGPGDEVIVPPFTMSATAMAPLVYGGIPVFADIESDTFCLDPDSVRREITEKTKAIIAVNLFGHPARLKELKEIADKHGIYLIEDNAQSPFASEHGAYAGTIGHIGVFSLNYHKHIHTGEGGVCCTNDDELALRLKLIRNHGENAVAPAGLTDLTNMIGFNYRLTELSAAIGLAQLEDADRHLQGREDLAHSLTKTASGLKGLTPPVVRNDCRHVYYVWALRYSQRETGVSRELFSKALNAEGFPNYTGYVKPLYLLPLFQNRVALGSNGFPFNLSTRRYDQGLCPVVEQLHNEELIWFPNCMYQPSESFAKELCAALQKVHCGLDKLKEWEAKEASANTVLGSKH